MTEVSELQAFVEASENEKGDYGVESYDSLVRIVTDLKGFLDDDDVAGIYVTADTLETYVNDLRGHARSVWTQQTTVNIIKELLSQDEANTTEGK